MKILKDKKIVVKNARENNLKSVNIEIPHGSLTVVTGVSGSGKSSLVFDTILREGQRRYLESLSAYGRQFFSKISPPDVEKIESLPPALAIDQKTTVSGSRSTVGTMSEIYSFLRLLFARLGSADKSDVSFKIERRLFSFNSPYGSCPRCKGVGVEDRIDPELLISDSSKSIRDGAFSITTSSNYIMYSQVTMDVLNTVCQAHGFNVYTPWNKLSEKEKNIVLFGSDKIVIPFGKHTLESRMKWTGITAKPRDEGYYKGILPVMEEILKRDRNKNILRYAKTSPCSECNGAKLRKEALFVKFMEKNITDYSNMSIDEIHNFFTSLKFEKKQHEAGMFIREAILKKTEMLKRLGVGYLTLSRESRTISAGEAQRIRLSNLTKSGLHGILYVLDEPSVGLHQSEKKKLYQVIRELVDDGSNTVIAVEHDERARVMREELEKRIVELQIQSEAQEKGSRMRKLLLKVEF